MEVDRTPGDTARSLPDDQDILGYSPIIIDCN